MRRTVINVLTAALAISVSASTSLAQTAPTLKIRSLVPLTVVGSGFAAHERVALTLRRAGKRVTTKRVLSSLGGTFRARFSPLVATDSCRGSLVVVALGTAGSRASVSRSCRPPDPQTP